MKSEKQLLASSNYQKVYTLTTLQESVRQTK